MSFREGITGQEEKHCHRTNQSGQFVSSDSVGAGAPETNLKFSSITTKILVFLVLCEVRREAYTSSATKNKVEFKRSLLFNDSPRRLPGQLSTQESQELHWQLLLLPVPLVPALLQSDQSQTQEGRPHRSPHYFSNNNYHLLFSSVYEKLLNSLS